MIVLKGLGLLFGIILVYLITIIFSPYPKAEPQPVTKVAGLGKKKPPKCRETVKFRVGDAKLSGWLYLPETQTGPVPCVVLSTGFCGTKDMILENYALKFVEAGYAALVYDYRFFGESEGEPRQLYSATHQLKDLEAAIMCARKRTEIDADKVVLWGTSAGGNYGIIKAAQDARIAGIIVQAAALDHKADSKLYFEREGYGFFFRIFMHAQRDKGRSRFDLSPHMIPGYGPPSSLAMLTAPGAYDGIAHLAKESETFRNEFCGRSIVMPHPPDPLKYADQVQCPVLFSVCEKDGIVSPVSHVRAAEILGERVTVKTYPITHFEIYEGQYFEESVQDQIAFLDGLKLK